MEEKVVVCEYEEKYVTDSTIKLQIPLFLYCADADAFRFTAVTENRVIHLYVGPDDNWRAETTDLNEFFVAKYGETTWEELKAAYDTGKLITVNRDGYQYSLYQATSTQI